ncbi:Delta2-dienoyl-CoA-isomerase [Hymenopellis radicata]|nr:Delta2-dienoyl-CoA-isomerase [Hymenopellis radicata]
MAPAESFSTEFIKVTEPSPHVYHVDLARTPVNAFSAEYARPRAQGARQLIVRMTQILETVRTVFDRLAKHGDDVRAVVLSSALPKIFSAGLDCMSKRILTPNPGLTIEIHTSVRHRNHDQHFCVSQNGRCQKRHGHHRLPQGLSARLPSARPLPFPVIVAVHGPVIGLGIDMMCSCDIRYAASSAVFTIKEVDAGLAADIGTLAYLPKITGNLSMVRELAYTSRIFTAPDAQKLGLLSKVVQGSRNEVVDAALELAKVIASKSPIAVVGTKKLINHALDHSITDNLEYTAVWNGAALQSQDIAEIQGSAKLKKAPQFAPMRRAKL